MASRQQEPSDVDVLRGTIRQLKAALEQCHRLLAEAQEAVRQSHQDNDPPAFRVLYFCENVFQRCEEIDVADVREAIEVASSKPPHFRAEVWSNKGRVIELDALP